MRVSLSWIRRLLNRDLGVTDQELADKLSIHTCEIEGVQRTGPNLDGVVVGRVLTCVQHPNADRLRVITVDVGGPIPLPIVCGAPNVAVGQTVAVATVGTSLTMPGKDGKPTTITIKEAKLRGELSRGMICAEDELGLGASHDGIMVLSDAFKLGTPLAQALGVGDAVLEVSNTAITHRADLWGHLGWAREVAAILKLPAPAEPDIAWTDQPAGWSAKLADAGGWSYCGAVVEGVANHESPKWMRDLLEGAGVRPLGLLVDVTNFVMLELGEPMHAFDVRSFMGREVSVRTARKDEQIATLDGRNHTLAADDLVIADGDRALAVAGVIGGSASAVRADTSSILLEAASFAPERIRRTRLRHGIATDSAARFEKTIQPELGPAAINRAVALLAEICPGSRVTARFHVGPVSGEARTVAIDLRLVDTRTGLTDGTAAAREHLRALGFTATGSDDVAGVTVPWFRRKDVQTAPDLIEEAGRMSGWHRIKSENPRLPAIAPRGNPQRTAEHRIRDALSAQGWDEVCTYVYASPAWCAALGLDESRLVRLEHPPQPDWTFLRPSMLPGLLRAVTENRKSLSAIACYEVGKRYGSGIGRGTCADEATIVCGVVAAAHDQAPFFAARDAALAALSDLGYEARARPLSAPVVEFAAGRAVELCVNGKPFAVAGEVPKALRDLAGCPERVGWFRIELERLIDVVGEPSPIRYVTPSRFQSVENDFTWECAETQAYAELADATRRAGGALVIGVDLVGIYRGAPYQAGRKAVTIRATMQSEEKTLEEADIQAIRERVIALVTKTGAALRG
ncbi:MAG: phenylalanine--tRNA ligase subunit beta [Planctomycetota bacterium]